MPDFVVKTTFKGADKLSPLLARIGGKIDMVGGKATRNFRKASKSASVFGGVLKGIVAAGAISRGINLASRGVRELSEEFVTFDKNITKAVTRIDGGLGRSSVAFKKFGEVARKEAARTEFTAGEAAAGVEQLALAGFNVDQVMKTLPGVLNLATNAEVELAQAATMATKTLGAFGLKTDDTAKLQTNLTRVNDVMSRTVSSATLTMEQMFEVLKFGGPAANAAGQDLETFAALTGVLADSAVDASVAGTSLRSMFISLAAPTPKARGLIKKLSISVKDSSGNFRDFLDIMADVEKGTAKMGNVQKLAALKVLFGKKAINAADIILKKGTKTLKAYRQSLIESGGASKKMSDEIRRSIEGRLKRLKSALIEVGFKFIEAFNKGGGESLEKLIKRVNEFDVKPVVKALKDVIKFSKELWTEVKRFEPLLVPVIALWAAYKTALLTLTVIEAARFFVQLAGALKTAAAGQGLLNLAMATNPVALLTIAILGLGAALAILITRNDDVVFGWEENITRMGIAFTKFKINMITAIRDISIPLSELISLATFGLMEPKALTGISNEALLNERASLKDQQRRLQAVREQSSGTGVKRGPAGIRGHVAGLGQRKQAAQVRGLVASNPLLSGTSVGTAFGLARDPKALIDKFAQIAEKQQSILQSLRQFNPIIAQGGGSSDINVNFANAPAGTTVDQSRRAPGTPKVNVNQLGGGQ